MPILANAKKALRVSKRRALVNNKLRSQVKTTIDKVRKTKSGISTAFSNIDKAVKRNLMHKNKAARLKSQMARLTKDVVATAKAAVKPVAAAKKVVAQKVATKKAVAKKSSAKAAK